LIGHRHTNAVAKEKLIPAQANLPVDKREPHERFSDFASRIVSVPKKELDKREAKWRRRHRKPDH
jgi:hypothetical protein